MRLTGWTPVLRLQDLPSLTCGSLRAAMQLAAPRANARAKGFAACVHPSLAARLNLPCRAPCGGAKPFARAFGGGRGFAPHSWTERLGALCLPWLWSLPLPSPVSGSTAAPPGPARWGAPAGSGWTPEPPLRGSPANRLGAICPNYPVRTLQYRCVGQLSVIAFRRKQPAKLRLPYLRWQSSRSPPTGACAPSIDDSGLSNRCGNKVSSTGPTYQRGVKRRTRSASRTRWALRIPSGLTAIWCAAIPHRERAPRSASAEGATSARRAQLGHRGIGSIRGRGQSVPG